MAYDLNKLNADLKKLLAEHKPKKRVTFHKASNTHDKAVEQKKRTDRHKTKRDLKRGDWS